MAIISLKDVSISYGTTVAVENVSFDIEKGDFFCLAGCNGSGKTSVIKAVLRLVPLTGGRIDIGIPAHSISYIPQVSALPIDFPATNFEVVLSGCQKQGKLTYNREDKESARNAMKKLGIFDAGHKGYSELSGGQRQKVLIARAICSGAEFYVFDEPANALDESSAAELYDYLHEQSKSGKTVLLVTHDLAAVKKYATKIAVMGTKLEFLGNPSQWEQYRAGGAGRHFDE